MSSDIGLHASQNALQLVKSSTDTSVSWKSEASNVVDFAIRCLQIFSDKSLTLMSAVSLHFYFPHVALPNFTKTAFRQHVMNGNTIVVYLRTEFSQPGPSHESVPKSHTQRKSTFRLRTIKAFHESIKLSLGPLYSTAHKGLARQSRQRRKVLLYII